MTLSRFTAVSQTVGVQPSVSNSDDYGEKLDTVSDGSSLLTYTDLHSVLGDRGIKRADTATTAALVGKKFTATRDISIQFGLYLTAYPSADATVFQVRKSPDARGPYFKLDTSGRLVPYSMADTAITTARTSALTKNALLVVDIRIEAGTTSSNGAVSIAWRELGDPSATEDLTATGQNMGATTVGEARWIKVDSGGDLPESYWSALSVDDGRGSYIPQPTSLTPLSVSHIVSPTSGAKPLAVTATATASDGTGTYDNYVFHWDDGTSTGPQSSNVATHTYNTPGTYSTTVDVEDV